MTNPNTTSRQESHLAATRAFATPYLMGVIDAQQARALDIAQYDHDGDRAEYREGYQTEIAAIAQYGKDGEQR